MWIHIIHGLHLCPSKSDLKLKLQIQLSTYNPAKHFSSCAWWKVPTKYFKICHISYKWKLKVTFSIFHFKFTFFSIMNALVYRGYRVGHILKKNEVAQNEKINVAFLHVQNFEAFQWNFSSSTNLKIGRSNSYVCEASSKHISKKQRKYDAYQFWCQDTSILTITFLNAIKTCSWILYMHA